ncbi:glycosyl hydrolase family 95 catalytic domain-containing protein [Brachybacterium sp. J153]|uniref:glycosyl hydrolase family 95 catalytic domain-containing protein n=1 Tax=Brachybacterium sp. J153 TaxID=3116488 RepID=UPI002E784550|nr:glycoside hydrolase N-terminal domain-containing protein [Brachybacterium sp. J153]MEE1617748.1 glycoside hydrolase N-terminal domain-containing protein [Brachybacterium sp. J153]
MASCTDIRRPRPADRWLEALPLGNGRIGAMVWGDPTAPRFSLNESTLWSGSPTTTERWHTGADDAEAARRRAWDLFRRGEVRAAQEALEGLGAAWSQAYQPVGELVVRLDGPEAPAPADYERVLDLSRAEHVVRASGAEHLTLVSLADEVLVHAMPCPAGVAVALELTSPLVEERRSTDDDGLTVVLRAPSDGVPTRHAELAELAWDEEGASRAVVVVRTSREYGRLLVTCAIGTTWQGLGQQPDRDLEELLAATTAQAEQALERGEAELRRRHRETPLPGIDEVALELAGSESAQLLATMVAYGRHLLASSSRAGLPPANLQGIWNDRVLAPWNSNYTVNINLEMNHWAAGVAHVPAAAEALEGYTAMLRRAGRDTARRLYGARGWTVHHNSDPWGYTDPVSGDPKWATWPMGGLWLERELDSIASFSGEDTAAIAVRRFPALREAAAFALDLLHEAEDGTLVTFPSTSPENEWLTEGGEAVALTAGGGMNRWLLHDVLGSLLASAELLGRSEDEVVREAAAALPRIPGPRIGADGRVLEWHLDGVGEVEPTHRHVSHLGFEYPGATPQPPEVSAAVVASMEARGDEATGWSLAWKTALWARLRRADKVQDLLELFLRPAELPDGSERSGLYPNLFSAHPPFQIDGNIGIVAAIAECLVQSHRGEIELLPAAALILASGSVRGLRARPGVAVDMKWEDGAVTALSLRAVGPGALGLHRVRHGELRATVELRDEAPVTVTLQPSV